MFVFLTSLTSKFTYFSKENADKRMGVTRPKFYLIISFMNIFAPKPIVLMHYWLTPYRNLKLLVGKWQQIKSYEYAKFANLAN